MTLDPETWISATEIALVGGLTGAFSQDIYNSGRNWILARFIGHPKEAQESAQHNVNNFFGEVNIRVGALEKLNENIEDEEKRALSDPDYTYLLYEAVLGAARTNSEQKHKLLARLVTDRLAAEPDSLRTLAAHMACNAVPQLSNMHLKLLGVLYIIRHQPAPSYIMDLPYDERIDVGTKWCLTEIAPFIPIGEITDLDFAHLTAVSCITYVPQSFPSLIGGLGKEPDYWKLLTLVYDKFISREDHLHQVRWIPEIGEDKIGKDLLSFWDNSDMRKASLTPAGSLIGMYVRDTTSREHRCI
jgi:hypothetical protein